MLTLLKVFDTTTASIGKKPENSFTVYVSGETITARELIRLRIFQEVEKYNEQKPEVFRMLVQPGQAEQTLNGYKFPRPQHVDPQVQFEKAIQSFENIGFIVLVDDQQVSSLDEAISLRPETSVTFLKLVPLVGG